MNLLHLLAVLVDHRCRGGCCSAGRVNSLCSACLGEETVAGLGMRLVGMTVAVDSERNMDQKGQVPMMGGCRKPAERNFVESALAFHRAH